MFSECFKGVLGTGGCKTAGSWGEWRNADLVESDQQDKREYCDLFQGVQYFIIQRFHLLDC